MSAAMGGTINYYNWLYTVIRPYFGRCVLEIGPGFGNIARLILKDNKRYYGLDITSEVICALRDSLPVAADNLVVGDINQPELPARFAAAGVDTLLSINVLEHVSEDKRFMESAARCVPGGTLIIVVPAMPGLYGSFDEEAGHIRRYTKSGIKSLITAAGATVRRLSYFNALGAISWFASARIMHMRLNAKETNCSISLYDRYVIPLTRLLDPCFKTFFGQSLIVIANAP